MQNRFFLNLNLALLCLSSASLVFAEKIIPLNPTLITQNGFYLGADIGAANFMNKESHSITPESHQLGSLGMLGGVFVGYDYGLNQQFRFAIEGFVNATSFNTSIKHANVTYKMNQYYDLGVRVLPEYVFTCDTTGHLILGYVNGRFNINDNGVYGIMNTTYNRNGFQAGLGLTTTLINHIFARLDAIYNSYAANTNQGLALAGSTSTFQSYTNHFSQLAGEFSIIYKFC